jgi:hypothetical protein
VKTYTLRAVTREEHGTTHVAQTWPLTSAAISGARMEVDAKDWGPGWDKANAFEIHESGAVISWRPLRSSGELADWT